MSDLVARAMAALGEHVTPGPWVVNTEGWAVISSGSDSVLHGYVDTECENCGAEVKGDSRVAVSIEDAEFIAAARALVPELVAEIERLRAVIDRLHYRDDGFCREDGMAWPCATVAAMEQDR